MGTHYSPSIVRSGLVMHYDMANTKKSWKGAPTINYIPSPNASHNGSAFVNMGYNYQNLGSTLTYVTGVDNPINSPGVLEYYTGTSGYKYFSIDSTSLPTTGTYTFSYYARLKVSGGANNTPIDNQLWRANGSDRGVTGDWNHAFTFDWVRYTTTGPAEIATVLQYFISHSGSVVGGYTIQYCGFQLEVGSYATPFVVGTRSSTQAIVDLTNNVTITANSLTYDPDGTFSFNGTSNYITVPSNQLALTSWTQPWTLGVWMYVPASATWSDGVNRSHFVSKGATAGSWGIIRGITDNTIYALIRTDAGIYQASGGSITRDAWYNVVGTWDGISAVRTYINGVLVGSATAATLSGVPDTSNLFVGRSANSVAGSPGLFYNGKVFNVVGYTRALTAAEVTQNFNATRGRYGI